jgi:hypothetical protein
MAIGSKFTLSLHEKASLRKILQSWRGKAFTPEELKKFDVTTILGKPCLITVTHEPKDGGGVYANVGAVRSFRPVFRPRRSKAKRCSTTRTTRTRGTSCARGFRKRSRTRSARTIRPNSAATRSPPTPT